MSPRLDHADPLVAGANVLAVALAASQPTYPLYVWLIAGEGSLRAAVVLLAVPFFLAVPLVARRRPYVARVLLVLTATANTVVAARAMGAAAGLDYLVVPCAALGAVFFRAGERRTMLVLVALCLAAWLCADAAPEVGFSAAAYAALRRMNAMSAVAVCGLIAWIRPAAALPSPPPRA